MEGRKLVAAEETGRKAHAKLREAVKAQKDAVKRLKKEQGIENDVVNIAKKLADILNGMDKSDPRRIKLSETIRDLHPVVEMSFRKSTEHLRDLRSRQIEEIDAREEWFDWARDNEAISDKVASENPSNGGDKVPFVMIDDKVLEEQAVKIYGEPGEYDSMTNAVADMNADARVVREALSEQAK